MKTTIIFTSKHLLNKKGHLIQSHLLLEPNIISHKMGLHTITHYGNYYVVIIKMMQNIKPLNQKY